MFDKDSANITLNKWLGSDGSETTGSDWEISEYIPIAGGMTYTTSGTGGDFGNSPARCYYTANKTFISGVIHGSANPFTDTAPSNAVYMRETIRKTLTSVQIEEGSTATPYQQFIGGQLELCKIGDYQDYIYKSGDDWYVHKAINKSTLDGTENWSFASGSLIPFRLLLNDSAPLAPNQDTPPSLFMNYYSTFYWNLSDRPNYGVTVATSTLEISKTLAFRNVDISTLADWKTWLSTHNTTLYYPLATATDIQITDSSVVAQLEALLAANSYDPTTVFTASSEYLPAILSVSTLRKSLAGVLEAIRRQ